MQDGWQVETRVRLQGKQAGSKYRCFKSPSGVSYWSLGTACKAGFSGLVSGEGLDGRCKRKAAAGKTPAEVLEGQGEPGKKKARSPGKQ